MKICPDCNKEIADNAKFCDGCGTEIVEAVFCPKCGAQVSAEATFCQNCGVSLAKENEDEKPKTCPNCGKELVTGAKFCDSCGTEIVEAAVLCPKCGAQVSAEATFCQSCGASLAEPATEEQPEIAPKAPKRIFKTKNEKKQKITKEKKNSPKKAFLFGGIGAAVIIAAFLVAFFLLPDEITLPKSKTNYALFLKDKEIFYTDLKEDSIPWQLTAKLNDTGESYDNSDLTNLGSYLDSFTYMSKDGKYIFFPDKFNSVSTRFNLYCRNVETPEAEAIKIDSDISSYAVSTDATIVTYLKGDSGDLYQYKIDEDVKDKIASNVLAFEVSDDGKKIGYYDNEDNLYLKYADKDKEKIASEISSLEYVSSDFKTVYYVKDGSLYKQVEGEDKEKIASDVLDVLKVYDSGEIYYVLTGESTEKSLADYVNDDLKDADAALVEPVFNEPAYPTYPSFNDYGNWEDYYAAQDAYYEARDAYYDQYDIAWEEYNAAYDLYEAKLTRDTLREQLQTTTLNLYNNKLCFFDGKETVVLTDTFTTADYQAGSIFASDAPVISYRVYNPSNVKKINFSEITDIESAKFLVQTAMSVSYDRYLAAKGSATVLEPSKDLYNLTINASGTAAYYIDNRADENDYGELYRISIDDGVVAEAELYDSDVYCYRLSFVSNDQISYFKEYNQSKFAGDLYINKNRIDYEVFFFSIGLLDTSDIFYITDYNQEKRCGTLKVYDNEKAAKIADDVFDYAVMPNGHILYLRDYSLEYYKGELYEWNGSETGKISDDVIYLFPLNDEKYRGTHYSW